MCILRYLVQVQLTLTLNVMSSFGQFALHTSTDVVNVVSCPSPAAGADVARKSTLSVAEGCIALGGHAAASHTLHGGAAPHRRAGHFGGYRA